MATLPYRRTAVRLLGFLRPYRWSLVVSIVLAVGSQAAAIAIACLTGAGLENGDHGRTTRQRLYEIAALVARRRARPRALHGRAGG